MWISDLPKEDSIKCGDLFIPSRAINSFIKNCVRPVLCEIPDAPDELRGFLSSGGSASLVKINGECFVCITRHQVSKYLEFKKALDGIRVVSFTSDEVIDNITFTQAIFVDNQPDEEISDVLFLRTNIEDKSHKKNAPYYLPLRELNGDDVNSHFIFVGYPINDDAFEFDENGVVCKYNSVGIIKDCYVDKDFKSKAKHFNRYTFAPYNFEEIISENGLSGGSVFGVKRASTGFELFHSGVIVRAGSDCVYTVSTNHMISVN